MPARALLLLALFCLPLGACSLESRGIGTVVPDGGRGDARSDGPAGGPEAGALDVPVVLPEAGVADAPDAGGPLPDAADAAVDMAPVGCPPGSKACASACIPSAGCCGDGECAGGFACVAASCSATMCRAGMKRCGPACIPMATCCPAEGCCSNADCQSCQKCVAGMCVNQALNEDLKNDCPAGACRPGKCNGAGACNVSSDGQNGPSCGGECVRCQAGACRPRTGMCSSGQQCDDGRCPPRPPFNVRINVNGPQHGNFAADPGPGGICNGSPFNTAGPINGTTEDALYQAEMFGAPLACAVGNLPAGPYDVVLHFAEIFWGPTCLGGGPGTGARVFDIQLEGKTMATKVDIFSEGGCPAALDGSGRPVVKRFEKVSITDGTLNLDFPASANNAKLSAIEILSAW